MPFRGRIPLAISAAMASRNFPVTVSAAAALLVLGSAGALAFALTSQYVFGYQPCSLCIDQRWPYVAALGLGALGLLAGRRVAGLARGLTALAALAVLSSGAIGAYHFGVEQKWWRGPDSCTSLPVARTIEEMRAALARAPIVRCDDVGWSFLGISMAGYNVLFAGALGTLALGAALRNAQPRRRFG
jgi:disulfide bond formation protein DsbB